MQCLVHLVTGAASSQQSATAAPAVHSIAGECRQEGLVHNHFMCATASMLWSSKAQLWLAWQRHNFAWTATLLLTC